MFKKEVEAFLPGRLHNKVTMKSIVNSNGPVFVKNRAMEFYNVYTTKETISYTTDNNKSFQLAAYKHDAIPMYGSLIGKNIMIDDGIVNGLFYIEPDKHIVSLILDEIYFLLNNSTSEAYSLMGLISTTISNYVKENRINYIKINTGPEVAKIKTLEL